VKAYARKPLGPPARNVIPENSIPWNMLNYDNSYYPDYPDYYNGWYVSDSDSDYDVSYYSDSNSYYSGESNSSFYSSSYNSSESSYESD